MTILLENPPVLFLDAAPTDVEQPLITLKSELPSFDDLRTQTIYDYREKEEEIRNTNPENKEHLLHDLFNEVRQDANLFEIFDQNIDFRKSVFLLQTTTNSVLKSDLHEDKKQNMVQERIRQFLDETQSNWVPSCRYLNHSFPINSSIF